jgi:hypothetical protein
MDSRKDHLIAILGGLAKDRADRVLIANMITALDDKYDLSKKMPREPGVEEIITQLVGRMANAFGRLSNIQDKRIRNCSRD